MGSQRYKSRPIGTTRQLIYLYISEHPGCRKKEIMTALSLTCTQTRVPIWRGVQDGELIATDEWSPQYKIGKLIDRTSHTKRKKAERKVRTVATRERKEREQIRKRVVQVSKPMLTTKIRQEVKAVTITYPPNYLHTICPSHGYEPLDTRRHV